MNNHIYVTFFVVSSFLNIGQSGSIESNGVKSIQNLGSEKQLRNLRGHEVSDTNIGSIPMGELAGAYTDRIRQLRSYNYNGNRDRNNGMGLYESNGYVFGFDEGNPDIHGEIIRPCQVYDTFCIRKFFAEHSECKISGRAVPNPLYRAEGTINFPSTNITVTQIIADYGGLDIGRVSEFYINNVTDNLVIAITFDSASKFSNNTYYKYYLRGREPVLTRDFVGIQYGVLTVTVIIPHIRNLRLDRSEIYTYGDTDIFSFAIGPKIGISTDPEVVSMYGRFFTNIPVEYPEEISNQGNFFVENYIQYNICDFGLKIL